MKKYSPFLVYWIINSFVIYFLYFILSKDIVLGNVFLTPIYASVWVGLIITALAHPIKYLLNYFKIKAKGTFQYFVLYYLANSMFVWMCAKFPFITGIGISGFYWALIAGISLNFFQWTARQVLKTSKVI